MRDGDHDNPGLYVIEAVEVFWGEQCQKVPIYMLEDLKSHWEVMQVLMDEHEINWQHIGQKVTFFLGAERHSLEDNF